MPAAEASGSTPSPLLESRTAATKQRARNGDRAIPEGGGEPTDRGSGESGSTRTSRANGTARTRADGAKATSRSASRYDDIEPRSKIRALVNSVGLSAFAVVAAFGIRAVAVQAFIIPSESMEQTLQINDRVLVNKTSYLFGSVNRGDVIVFERAENDPSETRDLIKRAMGLPGDVIAASEGQLYINGNLVDEPYLQAGELTSTFGPIEVPEDHLFMMGDNRDKSFDSRFFGPVPQDRVVGRAVSVFWPSDRFSGL